MKNQTKGESIKARFEPEERAFLDALNAQTGLTLADLMRRSVRVAAPLFLSGEVDILTLKKRDAS